MMTVKLRKRYTLVELLRGADEMVVLHKRASTWETAAPIGNEIVRFRDDTEVFIDTTPPASVVRVR